MHILFLTHYFPPEVNAPASRTYEHAREWVKVRGVGVTVVTNHPNHPRGILYPGYRNRWGSHEEMEGIQVRRVKTYLVPNAGFVRRTLNYLFFMLAATVACLRVDRPDVVVATSPQFFCALAGYVVSLLRRAPFVFELRDIWPESIVTVGAMRPSLPVGMLEKVELFLYRKAACVVAVTDAFKENLTGRGVSDRKIHVIKNAVDLAFFRPGPPPPGLSSQLGAAGKFVVSYIGTVGMAHAVDRIVELAERLKGVPDIRLVVVGEGAEKARVKEHVARKGLTNIRVLPGVSKVRVRDYYAISDLFLVTLRDTPLFRTVIPSKVFEAMAMGLPIVCAVDGECRRIVQEAQAGLFVPPEDVEAMARTVLALHWDRSRLKDMGLKGRAFVEAHFDRKCLAAQYLRLLNQVTDLAKVALARSRGGWACAS